MEQKVTEFDLKIDEIIQDKIATLAFERISKEDIERKVAFTVKRFDLENIHSQKYHNFDCSPFEKRVMEAFYIKIGKVINDIMNNENYTEKAKYVAERIIENSRNAAEKYLTEKLALRMCVSYTDFNGDIMKTNMESFVNSIMNNHLCDNHNR